MAALFQSRHKKGFFMLQQGKDYSFSAFSTALKYLYELTLSSPAAASSMTTKPFWCTWRAERVT